MDKPTFDVPISADRVTEHNAALLSALLLIPFFGCIMVAVWQGILVKNVGVQPIDTVSDWFVAAGLGVAVIMALAVIERARIPLLLHQPLVDLAAKLGTTTVLCLLALVLFPHEMGVPVQPTLLFLTQLASLTTFYALQYAFLREGYRMLNRR